MVYIKFIWQKIKNLDGWPKNLIKLGIIFLLFWAVSWTVLDPDFGWHLQTGNYIRQHGIPLHDLYTYTALNFRWMDHEWGNDVLISLFYALGGYALLSFIFAGIWTVALLLNNLKSRLMILLLAALAIAPYVGIRPIAWTVLFFGLLLKILSSGRRKLVYFLPLLFILWANLHAGFIIGLALVAYFALKQRSKLLAALLIVCILATLINPYGPRLYVEVARTLFDSSLHSQIVEWYYAYFIIATPTFLVLWAAGFWLFSRRPLKNWLGIGPILFVAAFLATRNTPLLVVATTRDLDSYWQKFKNELPDITARAKHLTIFVLGLLLAFWLGYLGYHELAGLNWRNREVAYPVQAVKYLKSNGCKGHLFNDYNFGGYLIWKLPSQPVFIDGRMPSWRNDQGQKYMDIYFKVLSNQQFMKTEFAKYNIRCALLQSSDNKAINNLSSAGWKTTVQSNDSILLIN